MEELANGGKAGRLGGDEKMVEDIKLVRWSGGRLNLKGQGGISNRVI
jgi:hypothetical protein